MTASAFEAYLARLYVDAEACARFLADPAGETAPAGLSAEQGSALAGIDRVGLELAARSFAAKRGKRSRLGWIRRRLS